MPSLIARRQRPPLRISTTNDESRIRRPSSVGVVMLPPSIACVSSPSPDWSENNSCFVCEEGGELWSVCHCVDRLLHLECQLQLMHKTPSHRVGCPVCAQPYTNVTSTVVKRTLSSEGRRLVAFLVGVVAVVIIGVYECVMFVVMDQVSFLIVAIIFFVSSTAFLFAGHFIFSRSTIIIEHRTVTLDRPTVRPQPCSHALQPSTSRRNSLPARSATTPSPSASPATRGRFSSSVDTSRWRRHILTVLVPSPRLRSPRSPRVAAIELAGMPTAAEPAMIHTASSSRIGAHAAVIQ